MKFNPPCYSVTFELLESLTDSLVEKASLLQHVCLAVRALMCVSVCEPVCIFLNLLLLRASLSLRSGDTFHKVRSFWLFCCFTKGAVYGQGLN